MSDLNIVCPDWYQSVLQPCAEYPPCGASLEYDATFLMLQSRLQPRLGAEYGDFVETVEPLNWGEIEREARMLLLRSKDIRVVMILMRCRLRQIGVAAVCEGLEALLSLLDQWPDALHPQLLDEGEFMPLMRANAFAELEAGEGFLADFRQLPLPRVSGPQLSVRDVERAYTSPRDESAPAESTMRAIQQAWRGEAAIASLQLAAIRLRQLKTLLADMLGEEAPEFHRLLTLLDLFATTPAATSTLTQPQVTTENTAPPAADETAVVTETAPTVAQHPATIDSRTDALNRLREIRAWFNHAEPSSPVIALLAFTEQTVGKSFVELLQFLPAELMVKLESEKRAL